MGNHFYPAGTANTEIFVPKFFRDIVFPTIQKHFPTNRRRGSPQHNGRTPLFAFARAIETPPARKGCRNMGAWPLAKWLTTPVRACKKVNDSARTHCCKSEGRYPKRPAAEPAPNEARAVLTSSIEKVGARKRGV